MEDTEREALTEKLKLTWHALKDADFCLQLATNLLRNAQPLIDPSLSMSEQIAANNTWYKMRERVLCTK